MNRNYQRHYWNFPVYDTNTIHGYRSSRIHASMMPYQMIPVYLGPNQHFRMNAYHHQPTETTRKIRTYAQKRRDHLRRIAFWQRKSICSEFPFFAVDDAEIRLVCSNPEPVAKQPLVSTASQTDSCNSVQSVQITQTDLANLEHETRATETMPVTTCDSGTQFEMEMCSQYAGDNWRSRECCRDTNRHLLKHCKQLQTQIRALEAENNVLKTHPENKLSYFQPFSTDNHTLPFVSDNVKEKILKTLTFTNQLMCERYYRLMRKYRTSLDQNDKLFLETYDLVHSKGKSCTLMLHNECENFIGPWLAKRMGSCLNVLANTSSR